MKSKKAIQFLESVIITDNDDPMVYLVDAIHAVELAEQEMVSNIPIDPNYLVTGIYLRDLRKKLNASKLFVKNLRDFKK